MMIWFTFWAMIGIMWSWYGLLEYYFLSDNKGMTLGWEVLNICLNALIFPIGLLFGIFVFLVGKRAEDDAIDFDFTIIRLITDYRK